MDPISVLISVFGLIITVLLALIPYFRKVYFLGPELTIELLPDGGSSGNRGLSSKNDKSKGYVDRDSAIFIFEVTWKMNLRITNNSNMIAYYPEILFLNQKIGFTSLEKLDRNVPIRENQQITLKGTYTMFEELDGRNRTQVSGLPEHLKDLKILLKYKNPSKKTFYTYFTLSECNNNNLYMRKRPKDFKNNIH
jgi:hypothetical protein